MVYKTAPYLPCTDCTFDPQGSLNDEDMQNLAEWGFNMVSRHSRHRSSSSRTRSETEIECWARIDSCTAAVAALCLTAPCARFVSA